MSTVCSGNPSVPNSGVPTSLVIDANYVRSLLPPALAYLYPFIPMMHGLAVGNVATFCSNDPPTLGLPDESDFYNFVLGGPIGAGQVVNEFLEDVARHYLWYSICHCTVVSTPAPPTPPADPGDLPAINPDPIVSLPSTEACLVDYSDPGILYCGGNNPGLTPSVNIAGRNITGVRLTIREYGNTGSGFPANFNLSYYNTTTLIRADPFTFTPGTGTKTILLPAPPDGAFTAQPMATGTGSGCRQFETTVEYFCNGEQPGSTQTPCCPPDPALSGYLQQILNMVTLIQRQNAPFAYVPKGAPHTGVTGQGELSVQGLIGVQVEITASNVFDVGVADGQPDYLYTSAWINWGSSDGYSTRERLSASKTLSMPANAGAYTKLAYSLPPGIVVTIQELEREP